MLVVQSGYETAAEDYLIELFRPIWNAETNLVYGLGKHGDAATTRANKRSPWDTLHPGRAWAAPTTEDARTEPQIRADLKTHFANTRTFANLDEVLNEFLDGLRQA
jgi:Eco29kI restriction endonuclease